MSTVCSGQHLRREAADRRELRRLRAEQRRERHAVDVAARRGRRRVHVAVRIDPDQAERPAFACAPLGARRHRAGARGCDRRRARAASRLRRATRSARLVETLADLARCRGCTSCARRRRRCVSGIGDGEVAFVDDRAAERRELFAEAGNAEGGRPHVDAAAAATEIERHADDVDRLSS